MRYKIFVVGVIALLLCSCRKSGSSNKAQSVSYQYELVKAGKKKSFDLDAETRYNAFYLWTFSDNQGKEYLSFLNYRTNQILFYDFETCDFLFKMEMDMEGVDGVNQISGCYVKDFDNIYVSSYAIAGLVRTDTTKRIKQKIPYGTTTGGYEIVQSYTPSSHPYNPPVFMGDKLFITQLAVNRIYRAANTPVSVVIDTLNRAYEPLPFVFGDVLSDAYYAPGAISDFSREYNGKEFVYSFYADDCIYVASVDHKVINKVNVKSKYIGKIQAEAPPSDAKQAMRWVLETPHYGDLVYDKYREVYYRFAYPKAELDPNRDYFQKALFGRSLFSVIILDKEFNIIGETLFPEAIYNSYVFFVHPDGLYISSDYQINFDQTEDQLNFKLFKL